VTSFRLTQMDAIASSIVIVILHCPHQGEQPRKPSFPTSMRPRADDTVSSWIPLSMAFIPTAKTPTSASPIQSFVLPLNESSSLTRTGSTLGGRSSS